MTSDGLVAVDSHALREERAIYSFFPSCAYLHIIQLFHPALLRENAIRASDSRRSKNAQ